MYSEKIIQALIAFVFIVLMIKVVIFGDLFHSNVYKGKGYSMVPPPGWVEMKDVKGVRAMMESAEKPEIVTFVTPERIAGTDIPEASLSILTVKLANPTWMEDEFPLIVEALSKAGYRIRTKGQIQIDTLISWWVLYDDPRTALLQLEFYMVNDINRLYKIQFTTGAENFKKHRPVFEAAKDSIKFSASLW